MQDNMQNTENAPAAAAPVPAQKKGGSVAKILCVVFALVAVGLGIYLALDKTVLKDSVSGNKDAKQCVTEAKEGEIAKIADNPSGYIYSDEFYGRYYVTKEGDVYFVPSEYFGYVDGGGVKWQIESNDVAAKGTYTFKYSDFDNYYNMAEGSEEGNFVVNGYKINVSNIQYIEEVGAGQQKTAVSLAMIDKDGNMSILNSSNVYSSNKVTFSISKNIETNVAAAQLATGSDQVYTRVFYRDGSSKMIDDKVVLGLK